MGRLQSIDLIEEMGAVTFAANTAEFLHRLNFKVHAVVPEGAGMPEYSVNFDEESRIRVETMIEVIKIFGNNALVDGMMRAELNRGSKKTEAES